MNEYSRLAKKAVEHFVKNGEVLAIPKDISKSLRRKAGVFITIKKNGELRGCIGTYLSTKNSIAEEIVANAISTCSSDLRFGPVLKKELKELCFEVSLLSVPRQIENTSKHDPKRHGIIVISDDERSGLLLPGIDGVETTDQQISIAARKGGINLVTDKIKLFDFEIEKYDQ